MLTYCDKVYHFVFIDTDCYRSIYGCEVLLIKVNSNHILHKLKAYCSSESLKIMILSKILCQKDYIFVQTIAVCEQSKLNQ